MKAEAEETKTETGKALLESTEAVTGTASSLAENLSKWIGSFDWIPEFLVSPLSSGLLLIALLTAAWLLYEVFRPLILRWFKHVINRTTFTWDDKLLGHGVFRWLTHLLPGLLIYLLAPGLFEATPLLAQCLETAASVYLLVSFYFVFDSLFNAVQSILSSTKACRHLNLTALTQVAKLVTVLIIFLLCFAVVLQKPPLALLSGIGVLASVLMLVFKDVILGLVAGIQLSSNQMLAIGDWLEMPSHKADGDVEEIGLTTVKVRNWDKTITTIPTYALISESFRNWRGMSESGGRRIKRSILIDTNSIRLCSEEMIDRFRDIEHIADYIERKKVEIADFNSKIETKGQSSRVNGRRLTNVGTFRAYIEAYLRHHPDINQEMTLLVRQLAPDGRGLPIEIYCFSANKEWGAYESILADIFDHLFAVAPEFDLTVFQEPSGSDFASLAESHGGASE